MEWVNIIHFNDNEPRFMFVLNEKRVDQREITIINCNSHIHVTFNEQPSDLVRM